MAVKWTKCAATEWKTWKGAPLGRGIQAGNSELGTVQSLKVLAHPVCTPTPALPLALPLALSCNTSNTWASTRDVV